MENPNSDDEVNRLLNRAGGPRDFERPPVPVPTSGFFWWLVARVGPYAAYAAFGLLAIGAVIALIGGKDLTWLGWIGIPVCLLFLLYMVYLVWRSQQQKAAQYLLSRQRQQLARQEVVRQVLEESQNQKQPPSN